MGQVVNLRDTIQEVTENDLHRKIEFEAYSLRMRFFEAEQNTYQIG